MKTKQLFLLLIMSIMSVSVSADNTVIDGIKYYLNNETLQAEVIQNSDNQYSGNITIPETVDYEGKTYSVTSIGISAFKYCSGLTSIDIPNSVISIGRETFAGCSALTSIDIHNGVTAIGEWAFNGCSSLTSITIPNSVTNIGFCAFGLCI